MKHPAISHLDIRDRLGWLSRNWALITKMVMIVVQMGSVGAPRYVAEANRWTSDLANRDPHLWVYNKSTGELLAEIPLPANLAAMGSATEM